MINRITNLETLLKEVLIKSETKDKLILFGINRALVLAKVMKSKSKPRVKLEDASPFIDKTEVPMD